MNLLPVLTGNAAAVDRKLFWRYKANWQRAARIGDYKFLKILDNTFLFNVVEDPLERGNLKERHKDVYDRHRRRVAGVERVDAAGNRRELHPFVHRRRARRPLRLSESKRGARSSRAFGYGPAVAVAVTSWLDPLDPNDFGQADELRPGLGSTVWRYVSFGSIVLQKSKIERRRKSRRSWFIGRLPCDTP